MSVVATDCAVALAPEPEPGPPDPEPEPEPEPEPKPEPEPDVVTKLTPARSHCVAPLAPLACASALGQAYWPGASAGQLPWPLSEPAVAVQPLGTGMVSPSMGSATVRPAPPVTVG